MRGQAAVEYLITYGWAFVAILIVIGTLSYFGMLSPSRYLPARCDFGVQLECIDFEISGEYDDGGTVYNGRVRMQFRNNFGEDINITNIHTPGGSQGVWRYYEPQSSSWVDTNTWIITKTNISQLFEYRIQPDDALHMFDGDRYMVTVRLEFRRTNPIGPVHNITGTIFSTAKPATTLS